MAVHAERMRALTRRSEDLERAVLAERRAVEATRERLEKEEEALRDAFATMSSKRAELLDSILPDQLRAQSLNLRMTDEQLAVERARAIAQLRSIFPIAAERRDAAAVAAAVAAGKTGAAGKAAAAAAAAAAGSKSKSTAAAAPSSSSLRGGGKGLSGDAAPTAVRVCGLRVPDPGDGAGFQAHELSAGLGVLLHFVNLAARYLAAPTLHR